MLKTEGLTADGADYAEGPEAGLGSLGCPRVRIWGPLCLLGDTPLESGTMTAFWCIRRRES